jgi:predicted ribosomally synthesized peptide with SipW-like signal peptide
MKKKVLLSSIATIALCLCLIAGSTFALFTSKSNVNIAVTAGEVEMVAGIAITKLESVKGDVNGTIVDENGNTYSYEDVSPNFTNGGTAEVNGSVLTLDKITPGDKVTFAISGTNNSNVAIQYRYVIECLSGDDLMKGLEFTINGVAIDKYMESYTSPWAPLSVGMSMTNVPITIELPVSAGNEFQNKSTEIRVLVEAVQGNAVVDTNTDPVITYYNNAATAEEALAAIADPYLPVVNITESFAKQITVGDLTNKTINANGNNATIKFTGALDNVVVQESLITMMRLPLFS